MRAKNIILGIGKFAIYIWILHFCAFWDLGNLLGALDYLVAGELAHQ